MKNIQYTNIRQILDEVHRHPLMRDVTLEQVVSYLITFMGLYGFPLMYETKEEILHIKDFRAILPCDCLEVIQAKECKSDICLRSMTDTFNSMGKQQPSFKIQGSIIYTSIKDGDIMITYKSVPIDEDGFPKLINNPVFLKTFELYIKKEVFTILFDLAKISQQSLQQVQQEYYWKAGQLQSEFTLPDYNEMESIGRLWNSLLERHTEFDNGFRNMGDREYIRRH
jgi:hypothetical protein